MRFPSEWQGVVGYQISPTDNDICRQISISPLKHPCSRVSQISDFIRTTHTNNRYIANAHMSVFRPELLAGLVNLRWTALYRNLVSLWVAKLVVGGWRANFALPAVAGASLLDDARAVSSTSANATAMTVAGTLVKRAAKAASDSDVGHVTLVILSWCCADESYTQKWTFRFFNAKPLLPYRCRFRGTFVKPVSWSLRYFTVYNSLALSLMRSRLRGPRENGNVMHAVRLATSTGIHRAT